MLYDKIEEQAYQEDIPDELRQLLEVARMERKNKIDGLQKEVAKRRDAAVAARKASGIEQIWAEDKEYYLGIDDLNRSTAAWVKPAGTTGGLTQNRADSEDRCTAFFNITAQFCDAAAARMGDILLPSGDWNFVVKPTPVPDQQPEPLQGGLDQSPKGQQIQDQQAVNLQSEADKTVERAENRIKDWLTECSYHSEVRRVLEDCVIVGTGVLKGPVPFRRSSMAVEGNAVKFEAKIIPGAFRVDPWNFYPDPACGENIHDGNYAIEKDLLTAKQLRDMKGLPGYLSDQIDSILEEGPGKKYATESSESRSEDDQFEVWYCYCNVDLDTLTAMGVEDCSGSDDVPAIVTLVNDTAIKAVLNPLDTGGFPYDVIPWQQMAGVPWGMGIARKGRIPQEMLLAAGRALMDNAGLGARPMVVIREGAIVAADGKAQVRGGKVWIATEQADVRSVTDAITFINVPMMQAELGGIIELAYKMMEDATGVAFLLQGQQGSAPDTVGGMELLNRNASAVLRRMARTFDERVTEPHIRRWYAWLLQYGEDNEKGDMVIEAVGSSALVEREIQALETQQLLAASVNPAFGLDPEKTMAELLKIKRISPDKFQLDEAKKAQMQQQPPVIPAVEVAKIRVEADKEIAQLRADVEHYKAKLAASTAMHRADVDTDRDTAYNNSLAERDRTSANLRMEELKLKQQMAILDRDTKMLDYANKRQISLEKVKAELAKTAMTLRTQKELAGASGSAPEVATPAVEPPQHAPDGRAFQE